MSSFPQTQWSTESTTSISATNHSCIYPPVFRPSFRFRLALPCQAKKGKREKEREKEREREREKKKIDRFLVVDNADVAKEIPGTDSLYGS